MVFFDAKKSSKPDGALNGDTQLHELQQTLSGSSGSVSGATTPSSDPQLRGLSGSDSVNSSQNSGSVESFFQISNTLKTPAAEYTSNDKTASHLLSEFNSPEPKRAAAGAPFRFLWHVMDNAGVPMFFGKNDDDLDPSLRHGYSETNYSKPNYAGTISPGQSRSSATDYKPANTIEGTTRATARSATGAPSQTPHKIPESELEGTDSWVKDNDQMP